MTSRSGKYHPLLHRFTVITAVFTLFLIFVGGLVKSTESGLSVPDWPTTYGENMFLFSPDKMVGGVFYEHGHRLFASLVGAMILFQAGWFLLKESRIWVKRTAISTLIVVIFQGILGGLTVKFLLPVWISSAHAILAQMTLCLTVLLAIATSKYWIQTSLSFVPKKLFYLALFFTVVVWIQLVLGAVMRHSEAGLAAFDFPGMYGEIMPEFSNSHIYNEMRNQFIWDQIDADGKIPEHRDLLDEHLEDLTPFKLFIHFAHRVWGLVVFIVSVIYMLSVLKGNSIPVFLKGACILTTLAIIIQAMLGIFTIWSLRDIYITTSHVANGAFILALCFFQTAWTWRLKT